MKHAALFLLFAALAFIGPCFTIMAINELAQDDVIYLDFYSYMAVTWLMFVTGWFFRQARNEVE